MKLDNVSEIEFNCLGFCLTMNEKIIVAFIIRQETKKKTMPIFTKGC